MPEEDGRGRPDAVPSAMRAGADPVGGRWRMARKAAADAPREGTSGMAGAIRRIVMSGEITRTKMSHYLTA